MSSLKGPWEDGFGDYRPGCQGRYGIAVGTSRNYARPLVGCWAFGIDRAEASAAAGHALRE